MMNTEWKICIVFLIFVAIEVQSQTFTKIRSFNGTDGTYPIGYLLQGPDGNFYGVTGGGGSNNSGTIFRLTPEGSLTTVYNFCSQPNCTDGTSPAAGMILATNGNLFGTTAYGGDNTCRAPYGCGTVFKINSAGLLTTLHVFELVDGANPWGGLVQGVDGNLYGTTSEGGNISCGPAPADGCGTVFKLTTTGTLTTLHSFNNSDGDNSIGGLVLANDGNFYGTTRYGGNLQCGTYGCGTVFKITPPGGFSVIYVAGTCPGLLNSTLIQAADGNLYGTAENSTYGLTLGGTLTGCAVFNGPLSIPIGIVQGNDGNLYTQTFYGGSTSCFPPDGCGALFSLSAGDLHNFDFSDGAGPSGAMLQATNGVFYGSTSYGGFADEGCPSNGCGTLFSLNMGLPPFVTFVRNPTKAGQMFGILGQGFTGTANVSLNGTSVPFTIKSDTLITATVPSGGTTGPVTVATPTGTLTSNVPFRVLPQLLSFTPSSGPVGTQVTLTGVSLTQTTGVGFGDYTPAQFTVNSDTQVTATVPAGARTGPVGIQTQGGIAISTQAFTVTQ